MNILIYNELIRQINNDGFIIYTVPDNPEKVFGNLALIKTQIELSYPIIMRFTHLHYIDEAIKVSFDFEQDLMIMDFLNKLGAGYRTNIFSHKIEFTCTDNICQELYNRYQKNLNQYPDNKTYYFTCYYDFDNQKPVLKIFNNKEEFVKYLTDILQTGEYENYIADTTQPIIFITNNSLVAMPVLNTDLAIKETIVNISNDKAIIK